MEAAYKPYDSTGAFWIDCMEISVTTRFCMWKFFVTTGF